MSAPDPDEEGLLVGAGAFKVDRAHALKKLKLYQLPGSVGGWLLWARCAAACGAPEAELKLGNNDFSLRFAGVPLSRAELEDPFAPLFVERRAGRDRGFSLALGLLQAVASSPKEIVIESGAGAGRLRMTACSLDSVAVAPAPGAEERTVFSVSWPMTTETKDRFLNIAYVQFRSLPLFHPDRLKMTGDSVSLWPAEAAAGRGFRLGDALGRVALPSFYTPPDSHLSLYKLGVFVCEHREPLPWAKVQAWVNDDKLALSASQTGVARDARFKSLMRLLAREAEALAFETAREHPELMRRARAVMAARGDAQKVWDLRMRWGQQAAADAVEPSWWRRMTGLASPERAAENRLVLRAAERALWLKDVASRLKATGRKPPHGLTEAVRAALAEQEPGD